MAAAVAAAAASSSASSAGGAAAGGPIALAVVLALVITKEIFKARRTARREMLEKKYPPIQVETAAQRLKNLLGENGEAIAVAQILTPEQQMQIGILQSDFSYSEPAYSPTVPSSRQQVLQDLGISSAQRQQELRAKTGPIQPPGHTNPNWANDLAAILLNITNGNLSALNPYSLPYNEYYNLMMNFGNGEVNRLFKSFSNTSTLPNVLPENWKGNAYFSEDGTFLGIDLIGSPGINNQIIIVPAQLPSGFYMDATNKIVNPTTALTNSFEYFDDFLIENKDKPGFDKTVEKIFTRIGESVGVRGGIILGLNSEEIPAYTDPDDFQVYVNERLLLDFWRDYRNINAIRNSLYHESLHQGNYMNTYFDHAYIYYQQVMHESFSNSGYNFQLEQLIYMGLYILRASKEPNVDIVELENFFRRFEASPTNPGFKIKFDLRTEVPWFIIYDFNGNVVEVYNSSMPEVQTLTIY